MNKLHHLFRFLCVTIFIVAVLNGTKVYANTTILNKIEVTKNPNNYEIQLNTTGKTNIKKQTLNDKIIFTLKNAKTDNATSIIYTNTSNTEHVLLKQNGKNLKIEISGNNVSNSILKLNGVTLNIKNSNSHIIEIISVLALFTIGAIVMFIRARKKQAKIHVEYSTDMENKILKVAFNRRMGLIAQGTGIQRKMQPRTISQYNVRRVDFYNSDSDEVKVQRV